MLLICHSVTKMPDICSFRFNCTALKSNPVISKKKKVQPILYIIVKYIFFYFLFYHYFAVYAKTRFSQTYILAMS